MKKVNEHIGAISGGISGSRSSGGRSISQQLSNPNYDSNNTPHEGARYVLRKPFKVGDAVITLKRVVIPDKKIKKLDNYEIPAGIPFECVSSPGFMSFSDNYTFELKDLNGLKKHGVVPHKHDINDVVFRFNINSEDWEDVTSSGFQRLSEVYVNENYLLNESVYYHGSKGKINRFLDDFVGGEEAIDQNGPGIYFTTNKDESNRYGDYIHTVKLNPRKVVSSEDGSSSNEEEIVNLIKSAPGWEETATNWSEDPESGVYMAVGDILSYNHSQHDQFSQVWYDFYRYNPVEYVKNMSKMGYDMVLVPSNVEGESHAVVFNPRIIELKKVEKDGDDLTEDFGALFESGNRKFYNDQKELVKLSWDFIKDLADSTKFSMKFFSDNGKLDKHHFPNSIMTSIDSNRYSSLKEFVDQNQDLIVSLTSNKINGSDSVRGAYIPGSNQIDIRVFPELIEEINKQIENDGDVNLDSLVFLFDKFFRSTLLHELQHAYDSWRSGGNFGNEQKTKKYLDIQSRAKDIKEYIRLFGDEATREELEAIKKGREAFLNLKHEINARYAQALDKIKFKDFDVSDFKMKIEAWDDIYNDFKSAFDGWDVLSPKMKQRLTKRLAKTFQEEKIDADELVSETYQGQKDLEELSAYMIYKLTEKLVKDGVSSYLPPFSTGTMSGQEVVFGELSPFVKDTQIKLQPIVGNELNASGKKSKAFMQGSNGKYKIGFKVSDKQFDKIKDFVNGGGDFRTLYNEMMKQYGSHVLHELQHAYDDWRSNGKFSLSQDSKDYQDKLRKREDLIQRLSIEKKTYSDLSDQEKQVIKVGTDAYHNLPHEINARFAEAVRDLVIPVSSWDDVQMGFKHVFRGWNSLSMKDRKNLMRRLGKYYIEDKYDIDQLDAIKKYSKEDLGITNESFENKKAYKSLEVGKNTYIRVIDENVDPEDLVWHRDKRDRLIKIEGGNGWKLQMDNELPVVLENEFFIPKETYHRVIKGSGDLVIKIFEM